MYYDIITKVLKMTQGKKMPRLGISFEEVSELAEQILLEGQLPTMQKIRDALGSGSFSTISKYLNQWRNEKIKQSPAPTFLIPSDPVNAAVKDVWNKITLEAENKIQALRDKNEAELSEAYKQNALLYEKQEQLQKERDELEQGLQRLLGEKELLGIDLREIQQKYRILEERYQFSENQIQTLKEEFRTQVHELTRRSDSELKKLKDEYGEFKIKHQKTSEDFQQQYQDLLKLHQKEIGSFRAEIQKQNLIIVDLIAEFKNSVSQNHELTKKMQYLVEETIEFKNALAEQEQKMTLQNKNDEKQLAVLDDIKRTQKEDHLKASEFNHQLSSIDDGIFAVMQEIEELHKAFSSLQQTKINTADILDENNE